jgi:hypothetical protein
MTTQAIDVPLPDSLMQLLQTPVCIPLPKPGKVELTLPFGGATLKAFNDASKAIPDDCSLSFSLALQIGPILANMKCLMEALNVVKPLLTVVTSVAKGDVISAGKALPDLLSAVGPLIECITKFFVAIPFFVRDLLALLAKLLRCIAQQLRSVLNVMSGLSLQIGSAQAEGNTELLATLQCDQHNAEASAQYAMSAIEPILLILSLAEPFLGMANVNPIKTPQIGSDSSLSALQTTVTVIDELAKTLQLAADALGAQDTSGS